MLPYFIVVLLSGLIRDELGVYNVAFYIACGAAVYMALAASFAMCIIRRRKSKDKKQKTVNNNLDISYTKLR